MIKNILPERLVIPLRMVFNYIRRSGSFSKPPSNLIAFPLDKRMRERAEQMRHLQKSLFIFLLALPIQVGAVNPAPCIGIYCDVQTVEVIPTPAPAPDVINEDQGVSGVNQNDVMVMPQVNPAPTPAPAETPAVPVVNPNNFPIINLGNNFFQGCLEEGLTFINNEPDGTPICVPFNTHQDAENHRFSLAVNIFNHTVAVDFESRKRGLGAFGLYIWWDDYQFTQNVSCENTIWSEGEICFRFPDFYTAALHWWHANKHLKQLKDHLYFLNGLPNEVACNDLGWGGQQNNQARWKPSSETTGRLVVLLPNEHCSDAFGAQGAFGPTFSPLISNMRIEDEFGNAMDRGRLRHCGQHNNGRLHWDFSGTEGLPSPVFLRYEYEGVERCRKVSNPKADLGR